MYATPALKFILAYTSVVWQPLKATQILVVDR